MPQHWIQGAIKHKGSLRRALGIKAGNTIPKGKLRAAAKKSGAIGRKARFALELEKFHGNAGSAGK